MPRTIEPRLLDRKLAASYCGVSVNHFLTHVPVAPVEIGGKKLWDRAAIDRWLDVGMPKDDAPRSSVELLEGVS